MITICAVVLKVQCNDTVLSELIGKQENDWVWGLRPSVVVCSVLPSCWVATVCI